MAGVLLVLMGTAGPAAALPLWTVTDDPVDTVVETADALTSGTVDVLRGATEELGRSVPPLPEATVAQPVPSLPIPTAPPIPVPEPQPSAEQPVAPPPPPPAPTAPPTEPATDDGTVPPVSPTEPSVVTEGETAPSGMSTVIDTVIERAGLPLALILLVVLFLAVQDRIDRRDPKLAHAPLAATPDLVFPAGQART